MLERQRHAREHDAEQRPDARSRGVERAGARPVGHGFVPLTVSSTCAVAGSGSGTSRPFSSATAK